MERDDENGEFETVKPEWRAECHSQEFIDVLPIWLESDGTPVFVLHGTAMIRIAEYLVPLGIWICRNVGPSVFCHCAS
jgi:hypothetical protein